LKFMHREGFQCSASLTTYRRKREKFRRDAKITAENPKVATMIKSLPIRTTNPVTAIFGIGIAGNGSIAERIRVAADEQYVALRELFNLAAVTGHFASHCPAPILAGFADSGAEAMSSFEALSCIAPDSPVIVILEQHCVSDAVRFIRNGAFECLGPGATVCELSIALRSAFRRIEERRAKGGDHGSEAWRRLLVGQSPPIERVANIIRLIAPRRCTVLISGETGTGKEMVARAIHMAGDRSRRPMISVNCGALPENLIEAELFGHVRGAFTGATENRTGRFEQAEGGTLFLDEIGDLPYDLQAKLLRVLQEREIQKLGGTTTIKVNVRVIAATNANLLRRVQQGSFREDLYYRLNVVPVDLPALRERDADIPLLVNHFVRKVCAAEGISGKSVTSRAMACIRAYSWPGNVRQLENVVEQSVVMNAAEESLDIADFSLPKTAHLERIAPVSFSGAELPEEGMDLSQALRHFERKILDQALTKTQGNKTLAADLLRLPRTTLIHKLRALDSAA
jgi:DNA-binding NtrC family response regulator